MRRFSVAGACTLATLMVPLGEPAVASANGLVRIDNSSKTMPVSVDGAPAETWPVSTGRRRTTEVAWLPTPAWSVALGPRRDMPPSFSPSCASTAPCGHGFRSVIRDDSGSGLQKCRISERSMIGLATSCVCVGVM
jgi:hypothetical protein